MLFYTGNTPLTAVPGELFKAWTFKKKVPLGGFDGRGGGHARTDSCLRDFLWCECFKRGAPGE